MNDLENLLNLDGEVFCLDGGYWVKFEARLTNPTENIPHGIKYSLTLHDKSNKRVLGYDNAHSFKPKNKRYGAKKITYDHIHKKDDVFEYEFENAEQLLLDFWESVDKYTKG